MRKKNLLYTKLHTYLSYFTSSHHRNWGICCIEE
jgi:hypothetical protein